MCGINLIIDKIHTLGTGPIKKMIAATQHRGPQHQDFIEENGSARLFFGHNRLKIIDLSESANQPFISSCKRYLLIFNGEIYNFQDLKNELLDCGVIFRTHSDTEVLLNLIIKKGVSSISLLEGMFSFIFYDKEKEEAILARDRNGIKPLFYFEDENFFIASSEIKGILASGLVKKSLNETQIRHYLKFKYAKAPETFYSGIYNLNPGFSLSVIKGKAASPQEFFAEDVMGPADTHSNAILETTEHLLVDAISKHLYADVPVGLFLSGGVDSTLILALIKSAGLPMVPSFSIVHNKKEKTFGTKDYKFAKKAANLYGSYQYEFEVGIDELRHFDEFIETLDQPVADSAAFLTYKLSAEAKKQVGVILSGAGADEVFGGYYRHQAFRRYLAHYGTVKKFLPLIKKVLPLLPSGINHPFRKKAQLIRKFARNCTDDPAQTFQNFTSLSILKENGQVPPWSSVDPGDVEGHLKEALKFDRKNYLVSDILALTDQMSMANGLEVRVPYLDHHLLKYVDSLPAASIFFQERKWILNGILRKHGGKEFIDRKKEGMGLPFGSWVRTNQKNEAMKYLHEKSCMVHQYVPQPIIKKLIDDHIFGKADNTLELWALVVLEAWLQKEFKTCFENKL